jgi:hypothetical protein
MKKLIHVQANMSGQLYARRVSGVLISLLKN